MSHNEHHEGVLDGVAGQLKTVFAQSAQGVYIYLDDDHLICNEKFAKMLGYSSAKEVRSTEGSFLEAFVAESSQPVLAKAYQDAMQHQTGSTNQITWKTKTDKEVGSTTILVPIEFDGHLMALHFITEK